MVKKSLSSLFYITVVLLLFLFIFAVLGRQLFAGTLRPPLEGAEFANCAGNPGDLPPRSNYDSFWEAFVTTFQISIYDDWSKTMYMEMSATTNWAVVCIYLYCAVSTYICCVDFLRCTDDAVDLHPEPIRRDANARL